MSADESRLTDGERWALHELRRLRAGGCRPTPILSFLLASVRRATEVRAARPRLAAQARRWAVAGGLLWLVLALAGRQPFRRGLRSGLLWWLGVAVMLDWHLGMVETADGRPRPLGPADALTLARAWLVPVIADDLAVQALVAAAATDVLDGVVARATEPTRAGRDLEALVDAAVLVAALRAARSTDRLSGGVIALEGVRLAGGFLHAAASYFVAARSPSPLVQRAARGSTPIRFAGLVAAAGGRRRAANVLMAGGSLIGLAALARSAT